MSENSYIPDALDLLKEMGRDSRLAALFAHFSNPVGEIHGENDYENAFGELLDYSLHNSLFDNVACLPRSVLEIE